MLAEQATQGSSRFWKVASRPAPPCADEEWARKYGGIFLIFFGKSPTVVLSGQDAAWS